MALSKLKLIKRALYVIFFFLVGCFGIVFSVLYVNTFNTGFFFKYSTLLNCLSCVVISILTVLTVAFFIENKEFIYKLFFVIVVFFALTVTLLYFLKLSGILNKFDSIDAFREYINGFGSWTYIVFVVFQFLQVVVLPIPSFITVGAGVLLFGPFICSLLSSIGIILGSLVAFFVGRKFGYNVVKWLIGEKNLTKTLKTIKGKDKIVLTFMFLFPFFPDDVLCFVAGITSMSSIFFVTMIIVVRLIGIFVQSYSFNNNFIPYDTWWGILIWILFFVLTFIFAYIVYKYGDKIENKIKSKK